MNRQQFKQLLKDTFLEVTFEYNGKRTLVSPIGSGRYSFSYNDEYNRDDMDFDELISMPIYDGKTILDISDDITDIQEI